MDYSYFYLFFDVFHVSFYDCKSDCPQELISGSDLYFVYDLPLTRDCESALFSNDAIQFSILDS